MILIIPLNSCVKDPNLISSLYLKKNPRYLTEESQRYLKIAENCQDPIEKNHLLLISADLLINAKSYQDAEQILYEIDNTNSNTSQFAMQQILLAKINLMQTNLVKAKNLLLNIGNYENLDKEVYQKLYTTKAAIFIQTGEFLEALQELVTLEQFLTAQEEKIINRKNIWEQLQQLTPNFLHTANQGNFSDTMHGWLTIAYITKKYDSEQAELIHAIQLWKKNFPKHPANTILDIDLKENIAGGEHYSYNIKNFNEQRLASIEQFRNIKKIALLLPLSGPYKRSALAIKNGFLASYYLKKSQTKKPKIIIIDTNKQNISKIYDQTIEQQVDLIVGPLIKSDLDKLIRSNKITVPIIGLNNVKSINSNLFFQFGLSPELEARTLIEKATENNYQNVLVIVQNNELGSRMLTTISKEWKSLGGNIIDVLYINNKSTLNAKLKNILGIEDSIIRAKELNKLGINFNFDPRRRQDLDCIFLIANQDYARQIKPLLNFYYANKVPVYATSLIYSGIANQSLNRDLDGIQFCDVPWVLDNTITSYPIYNIVKKSWQENFYQYSRLYALGIDAYKLYDQMPQLLSMPEIGISGMTGMLKLDHNNVITRKLMWGTFENGNVIISNQKN